jgi:hypothetical protein
VLVIGCVGFEELCGFVAVESVMVRVRANGFDRFGAYVVWFLVAMLELDVFFVWLGRHLFCEVTIFDEMAQSKSHAYSTLYEFRSALVADMAKQVIRRRIISPPREILGPCNYVPSILASCMCIARTCLGGRHVDLSRLGSFGGAENHGENHAEVESF